MLLLAAFWKECCPRWSAAFVKLGACIVPHTCLSKSILVRSAPESAPTDMPPASHHHAPRLLDKTTDNRFVKRTTSTTWAGGSCTPRLHP